MEIVIEINNYNEYFYENIIQYFMYLINNANSNNLKFFDCQFFSNFNEMISQIENLYTLDLINYFNNIFTPIKLFNCKYSFHHPLLLFKQKDIKNFLRNEIYFNDKIINSQSEENLINDIKKYFDEETTKEINKDIEITQNFSHFYIEGNHFSKDNMKKIISFLSKEKFTLFAWAFNKDETKKMGLGHNIIKVGNITNKIFFYLNSGKNDSN